MPSLQSLREFKASFDEIGDEKAVLEGQNLPYEDLSLPEIEAEQTEAQEEAAEESAALDALSEMDLDPSVAAVLGQEEEAGEPEGESPQGPSSGEPDPALGEFDLDALLAAGPDDLPDMADLPDVFPDEEEAPGEEEPPIDLDFPGEGEAPIDLELPGEGEAPLDLDFPGEGEAPLDLELPEEGEAPLDLDFPGEGEAPLDLELPEEGEAPIDLDFPGEGEAPLDLEVPDNLLEGLADDVEQSPEDGEAGPAAEDAGFNLDLDLGGGLELGEAEDLDAAGIEDADGLGGMGDLDTGAGEEGLDLEERFGEADLAGENADSFDAFDLEQKAPAAEEEKESADTDLGDFTLPGIDDMFGGIPGQGPQEAAKGKTRRSFFSGPPPEEEETEEILLDEQDLARFRRTLAAYPLNLRLAIEEIIAEQAVPPGQIAGLVRLLTREASAKESAALAGKILGRSIPVPVQKKTGEQLEAERGSFAYLLVHRFLPIIALAMFVLVVAASACFLIWQFIYTPIHAENIYQLGYERIEAGEYERANQRFTQAFNIHRDKKWFYRYAEAFRDRRQYIYAERKYEELLSWYPRDKKGVLDYAALETYYRRNYEQADRLLRYNILEYNPNDQEALLAQGDNALAWGEIDPARYEDARFAYARLLERYGWTDPLAERMLKYFIRTDNLKEVIPLQLFFMEDPKKIIGAETLAELGGYLLDKRTEESRGVPNAYVEQISGVRDILLKAALQDPALPEAHYHLSRYYRNLGSLRDEELTLETALRSFEGAQGESSRRQAYHVEALARNAEILRDRREYFASEENLVKAIGLYQDALDRRLLMPGPEFGRLYAAMGDLEYFTKTSDMEMTLSYYLDAERNGYSSPEMLYRMGSAYYHQEDWASALERFFSASSQLPLDRRILLALGNTCYRRGDFFAAQGYYNRLLDLLEAERARLPVLLPNDQPGYLETAERLMIARNNLGATLEALARSGGRPSYRAQAFGLYAQAIQAWDALTRNPLSMIRLGAGDLANPGSSLPYLNSRNILYPQAGYEAQIFPQIDKDVLDPSPWEY